MWACELRSFRFSVYRMSYVMVLFLALHVAMLQLMAVRMPCRARRITRALLAVGSNADSGGSSKLDLQPMLVVV